MSATKTSTAAGENKRLSLVDRIEDRDQKMRLAMNSGYYNTAAEIAGEQEKLLTLLMLMHEESEPEGTYQLSGGEVDTVDRGGLQTPKSRRLT